jgi:hypothetical protein
MNQPDLHHEGPLTLELVSDLLDKVKIALDEISVFVPEKPDKDWQNCKNKWIDILVDCGLGCTAVFVKLSNNIEHRLKDDHKIVDNTLCVLRDFSIAKSANFEK